MGLETGASRFTFVDKAQMAPAQCVVTGQTTELVDLGRTINMYGRLYLSKDAIRELAEVAGLTTSVDATLQQSLWYNEGFNAAVAKEFDERLRSLIAELGIVADRISPPGVVPAEDAQSDREEPVGEPAVGGDDLRRLDEGTVDGAVERDGTGSSKRRGRVQRDHVDAAFQL